jgi:hypothetical protein
MSIIVRIDRAGIERELFGIGGQVYNHIRELGERVEAEAQRRAPVDSGRLRNSIRLEMRRTPGKIIATVSSRLDYAIYQERGTGIYAGRGMIQPRRGKYLVFTPKGSGQPVFAREVRGVPALHYLEKALQKAQPYQVHSFPSM